VTETTGTTIEEFCWSVIFALRQPMTAISGQVQRAQHLLRTDPCRASQALEEVVDQITRLDELLVDLYERERRAPETPALDPTNGSRHAQTQEGATT